MHLANWLKQKRMTAAEFAERLDVHRATVGRWLDPNSGIRPDWDLMPKIAEVTAGEVTANDFVTPPSSEAAA